MRPVEKRCIGEADGAMVDAMVGYAINAFRCDGYERIQFWIYFHLSAFTILNRREFHAP